MDLNTLLKYSGVNNSEVTQEKLEAQRKIINAKGERDAQIIISEGLTEGIIRIKAIDPEYKLKVVS